MSARGTRASVLFLFQSKTPEEIPVWTSIVSTAKGRDATVSLEHLCFCQHTSRGTVGVTESGVWEALDLELNPLLTESDVNPG